MSEETRNEWREIAFRKIGRNVVNLQRFERMLKLIIVRSDARGYATELAKIHQDRTKEASHKTLGFLVREFLNTVYTTEAVEAPANNEPAEELKEIWISQTFTIHSTAYSISKKELELREVVEQRNSLIHHWLAEVDFQSVEECQQLISRLDEQDARLKPHLETLLRQLGDIRAAQERLVEEVLAELMKSLASETDTN